MRYKLSARLAVLSNLLMWVSCGLMTTPAFAQTLTAEAPPTFEDGIFISLPVYITSLVATAMFTWTVAKYDSNRLRKLDHMEIEQKRTLDRMRGIEVRLEDLLTAISKND